MISSSSALHICLEPKLPAPPLSHRQAQLHNQRHENKTSTTWDENYFIMAVPPASSPVGTVPLVSTVCTTIAMLVLLLANYISG